MRTGRLLKLTRNGREICISVYHEGRTCHASIYVRGLAGSSRTEDSSAAHSVAGPTETEVEKEARAWIDARFPASVPGSPPKTRAEAEALLFEFTASESLRRHGRAVEQALRAYAGWFGIDDPAELERWGVVGLIHDFDYEQNPTAETHLHVGQRILRERGWPEDVVEAVCSHSDTMGIPRDTSLKRALYACDELVGFLGACAKVRPDKRLASVPVESVIKRLKDKAFARSVDRQCVYAGAELIGRPLDEHIAFLIQALLPIADELGL